MDLEEFVRQSLLSITNGVADAQTQSRLQIAPGDHDKSQLVSFEIAVTTETSATGGGSILSVVKAEAGRSHEAVNRISFNVPVYLQKSADADT